MSRDFEGKNILVTGATSGIGYVIANQLYSQGANLILVGRNQSKLRQMKELFSGNAIDIEYDLFDLENIEDIFKTCKDRGYKLDGLVHSAGMADNSIIRGNDVEAMRKVMDLNAFSFLEIGKYFTSKKYSNQGSSIVAISSIASILNDAGMVQYSSSKAALNSIVKTMAKEFLKRKIRVNAILPANVGTEMFTSGVDMIDGFMDTALERQPLGIIEPDQVSYLTEFLLSDKSKYITGELIVMGGGMTY